MYFMLKDVHAKIEHARLNASLSTDQIKAFDDMFGGDPNKAERILTIQGDLAIIQIAGVLTNTPDIFAYYFGGGNVTYSEIIAAVNQAEGNKEVREVKYYFNSAGGVIGAGFEEAMKAISQGQKPSTAIGIDLIASAAYGLAAQADRIEAVNNMVRFGSVGTVIDAFVDESRVSITNTESPNKRPDISTPEGQNIVRSFLDDAYDLFAQWIADGRSNATGRDITIATINNSFGNGSLLFSNEALNVSMIDSIMNQDTSANINQSADPGGETEEASVMDLKTIKAEHPALHAQILAEGENIGYDKGVAAEKDRVEAHLEYGKINANTNKLAMIAIAEGTPITHAIQAKYQSAMALDAEAGAAADDNVDVETTPKEPEVAGADAKEAAFDKAFEEIFGKDETESEVA